MNAILIVWLISLAVCATYTFVLPAWDAHHTKPKREKKRRASTSEVSSSKKPAGAA